MPNPSRPAPLALVRPLADRGRVLYADDIVALYGMKPNGKPRRSKDWVWRNFCPSGKHKDGRSPWWWEYEAIAWMDQQREGAA